MQKPCQALKYVVFLEKLWYLNKIMRTKNYSYLLAALMFLGASALKAQDMGGIRKTTQIPPLPATSMDSAQTSTAPAPTVAPQSVRPAENRSAPRIVNTWGFQLGSNRYWYLGGFNQVPGSNGQVSTVPIFREYQAPVIGAFGNFRTRGPVHFQGGLAFDINLSDLTAQTVQGRWLLTPETILGMDMGIGLKPFGPYGVSIEGGGRVNLRGSALRAFAAVPYSEGTLDVYGRIKLPLSAKGRKTKVSVAVEYNYQPALVFIGQAWAWARTPYALANGRYAGPVAIIPRSIQYPDTYSQYGLANFGTESAPTTWINANLIFEFGNSSLTGQRRPRSNSKTKPAQRNATPAPKAKSRTKPQKHQRPDPRKAINIGALLPGTQLQFNEKSGLYLPQPNAEIEEIAARYGMNTVTASGILLSDHTANEVAARSHRFLA